MEGSQARRIWKTQMSVLYAALQEWPIAALKRKSGRETFQNPLKDGSGFKTEIERLSQSEATDKRKIWVLLTKERRLERGKGVAGLEELPKRGARLAV